MHKHKLFIIGLGIFVAILVIGGFIEGGSPVSQQAVTLDRIRLRHFSDIRFQLENYYRINKSLPENLGMLGTNIVLEDPQTKQPYKYMKETETSYKLCTTFSTDSKDSADYYAPENVHKMGYDCISSKLPQYVLENR